MNIERIKIRERCSLEIPEYNLDHKHEYYMYCVPSELRLLSLIQKHGPKIDSSSVLVRENKAAIYYICLLSYSSQILILETSFNLQNLFINSNINCNIFSMLIFGRFWRPIWQETRIILMTTIQNVVSSVWTGQWDLSHIKIV